MPAAAQCSRKATKKYKSRKSPPFPANKCCGKTKKGNDKKLYTAKANKAGVCTWAKGSSRSKSRSKSPQRVKSVLKKMGSGRSGTRSVRWAPKRKWKSVKI